MDSQSTISDAEMQRRALVRARINLDNRTQNFNRFRQKFYCGMRRGIVFILGAAIVALVFVHRHEIALVSAQKMRMIATHVQKNDESSQLRKNALTHEKELDEVVGK